MSAPTLNIRDAAEADLDAVREIYNHEVRNSICTFGTQTINREGMIKWYASRDMSRHPLLVCDRGGEIAGWASLSKWSDRAAYDKAGETSVYVHADHRGTGVGRALYDELIHRARAIGYRVLIARVAVPNPSSERLHEAVGFVDVGLMREIGEKFGRLIDVRLMDLHLQHGDRAGGSGLP